MTYLREYLFRDEQARQPVRTLSGGERNRLLLAKALAAPSNMLVLDEPTNDLDADTLDLLQEALSDYDGTVLLVSHDRDFLDRLVTSTIALEGDGTAIEYAGGYSDYLAAARPARGSDGCAAQGEGRGADARAGGAATSRLQARTRAGRVAQEDRGAAGRDRGPPRGAWLMPISTAAIRKTFADQDQAPRQPPRPSSRPPRPSGWSSRCCARNWAADPHIPLPR